LQCTVLKRKELHRERTLERGDPSSIQVSSKKVTRENTANITLNGTMLFHQVWGKSKEAQSYFYSAWYLRS